MGATDGIPTLIIDAPYRALTTFYQYPKARVMALLPPEKNSGMIKLTSIIPAHQPMRMKYIQ